MTDRDTTFGVYVHWPFCAQKCPYCDFNSHVRHKGWDEARFLAAYKREIDWMADRIGSRIRSMVMPNHGAQDHHQAATSIRAIDRPLDGLTTIRTC